MAIEKLQIILDAVWRGKSAVQQASRDVEGLDSSVGKAQASWKAFAAAGVAVAAGVATVGVAAKAAWDELGEGAQLARVADQFDRLAKSINTTSDVMLGKLRQATGGIVSDARLVESAGQIMSLGLAKTEGDVVRLATLVTELGWDMQQVILTFANNSKVRLDSLGLSIEDVEVKMAALEAQGLSADKAFDLAVIQAGEEKLALLGSTADTTVGDIQRLQTAWENARDAFSIGFAEGAADEVALIAGDVDIATQSFQNAGNIWGNIAGYIATNLFGVSTAFQALDDAVASGVISQEEYINATFELQAGLASVGDVMTFVSDNQKVWAADIADTVSGLGAEIAAASSADRVLANYAGAALAAADAQSQLNAQLAFQPGGQLRGGIAAYTSLTPSQVAAGREFVEQQERISEAFKPGTGLRGGIQAYTSLTQKQIEAGASARELADEGDNLAGNFFGRITTGAEDAANAIANLSAETGSYFDQARRGKDFDPAEFFYEQALQAGASAQQLKEVLIGGGLASAEEAERIFQEALQRQNLALSAQAFAGPTGISFDEAFAGGAGGLAAPDFSGAQVDQSTNVNVGGVTIIIEGSATLEEIQQGIDNSFQTAADAIGT